MNNQYCNVVPDSGNEKLVLEVREKLEKAISELNKGFSILKKRNDQTQQPRRPTMNTQYSDHILVCRKCRGERTLPQGTAPGNCPICGSEDFVVQSADERYRRAETKARTDRASHDSRKAAADANNSEKEWIWNTVKAATATATAAVAVYAAWSKAQK